MTFRVEGNDYSKNVIAGTYEVNRHTEYVEFVNSLGKEIHRPKRDRVVGSLDMYFESYIDAMDFLHAVPKNGAPANVSLTINNTGGGIANISAYLEYDLVLNRDSKWNDHFERFTLELREV